MNTSPKLTSPMMNHIKYSGLGSPVSVKHNLSRSTAKRLSDYMHTTHMAIASVRAENEQQGDTQCNARPLEICKCTPENTYVAIKGFASKQDKAIFSNVRVHVEENDQKGHNELRFTLLYDRLA